MKFKFVPYIILLFISSIGAVGLVIYGLKYKSVKGAKAFVATMLIGGLWSFANALEMAGIDLSTKLFWANIQYCFYTFGPVTWLVLALEFTGKSQWVKTKNITLLSIIPIITIILVWTNPYHGLIRYNVHLNTSGVFSVIEKDYGVWFWIHTIYSYLLNSCIVFLLIRAVWYKNTIYRKQATYLLSGFGLLYLSNFFYVSGLGPIKSFDISPVLFSISGVIIGWGIFYFRLFELVPVARTTIIEEMENGIVVIDTKNRIIDINPQARKMLGIKSTKITGQNIDTISTDLSNIVMYKNEKGLSQTEFTFVDNESRYYFEVYISLINDYRKDIVAWVLILNDITALKEARHQISLQHQELAVMDERERMARDLHDNLGQILSFSNVQIQAIRQQIKKGNMQLADDYLLSLNDIIRNAHKDIREYVYNIRDNNQYKENFLKLLRELVDDFRRNSNIDISIIDLNNSLNDIEFVNKIGLEEKIQLLNITKEALTNILKHAEANSINVIIDFDNRMRLIIEDNGRGLHAKNRSTGSGLSIMNERTRMIGGIMKVESQSGVGTRIIVELPGQPGASKS